MLLQPKLILSVFSLLVFQNRPNRRAKNRDRIIADETRRHGNLNFTCCGTVRQPRYRLKKCFPATGSRETRQPRYKHKNNFALRSSYLAAVKTGGKCLEKPLNKTTAIQKLKFNLILLFLDRGSRLISRQPR